VKNQKINYVQLLNWIVIIALIYISHVFSAYGNQGVWLKGDLHSHSNHSDGDSSVYQLIKEAENRGFDYFVITDHDTYMQAQPTQWSDIDYRSDKLLLLYGIEWTVKGGHANIWSTHPFFYGDLWDANLAKDPLSALSFAHQEDALFSINHPGRIETNIWSPEVSADVDCVEVWNGMYNSINRNREGLKFWNRLLKQGRQITAVGGSDTHKLRGPRAKLFSLGNPTTWIYIESMDTKALLKAIKQGRVSISYSHNAPYLDFRADKDLDGHFETLQGDNIKGNLGAISFRIDIHVSKNSDFKYFNFRDRVRVYKNGKKFKTWRITTKTTQIYFKDTPKQNSYNYYRVELLGKPNVSWVKRNLLYGNVISMTNPIYIGNI
jgi:predicted transcriptional regulator with HTH domain